MPDRPDAVAAAIANGRNADGGWGYFPRKSSRIEPTAWVAFGHAPRAHGAREWLAGRQASQGWLVDEPGLPVNYGFNGLALLALLSGDAATPAASRLSEGVIGAKGLAVAQSPALRQDNSLQAWSWVQDTFSWVEPTAYCLLALKRARRLGVVQAAAIAPRVNDAERMLADRACAGGGWNYGNARVFDKDLRPHGPTTALALLALQDRRDLPCVRAGLSFLTAQPDRERSGLALALTLICLRAFASDHAVPAALTAATLAASQQAAVSVAIGNLAVLAALLIALSDDDHGIDPFRI
jgi:hypothetical protein